MSTLQLFVTLSELDEIICDFAIQRNLKGIIRTRQGYNFYSPLKHPSEFLDRYEQVLLLYLLPLDEGLDQNLSEETFQPRQNGAIKINPGGLIRQNNMSTILLTTFTTEDNAELPFKPTLWLRQLRKHLQKTLLFGVKQENMVFGGSNNNSTIGYSVEALKFHQDGVHWKQFIDGNVEFFPMKTL